MRGPVPRLRGDVSSRRPSRQAGASAPSEAGFTLIEVVVAIALIVIISVPLTGVFYSAMRTTSTTSARTMALGVIERETEAIRATAYSDIGFYSDETPAVPTNCPIAGYSTSPNIILGATTPAGSTPPLASNTMNMAPYTFTVTRCVVWASAQGYTGSSTTTTFVQAYKRVVVQSQWTDQVGTHKEVHDTIVYPGGLGAYGATTTTTSTTVGTGPPAAPVLVSAVVAAAPANTSEIDLSWTQPAGGPVNSYIIEWATNSSFSNAQFGTTSSTSRFYPVINLTPGTKYYFAVIALGSSQMTSNTLNQTTASGSIGSCTIGNFSLFGASSSSTSKTYLLQNGLMSESMFLTVTINSNCNQALTVAGVNAKTGAADPSSPWSMTAYGTNSLYAYVNSANQAGWAAGLHNFTVYYGGSPASPSVTKTLLVCSYTAKPNPSANKC